MSFLCKDIWASLIFREMSFTMALAIVRVHFSALSSD